MQCVLFRNLWTLFFVFGNDCLYFDEEGANEWQIYGKAEKKHDI